MDTQSISRRTALKFSLTGLAASAASAAPASDIVTMDAATLQSAIRRRAVTCAEVMAAHLDQIEAHNSVVNAVVALRPRDALMAEARDADAMLARGQWRGPLHGFPHAVKDLQAVKGIRFTSGSPIFKDRIANADGPVAARLRAAGVIFIGKTNTPEFGLGSHSYNQVYGVTRNAHDQRVSAGGSSGGAAVALALRMVPLADGSDYGGSLRNPAGWNGVYGFRQSLADPGGQGSGHWYSSQSVSGPMARSVADLALLNRVLTDEDVTPALSTNMQGKRIGWLGDFGSTLPHEPGVLDLCEAGLKVFDAIGCPVEPAFPEHSTEAAWQSFRKLRGWMNVQRYRDDMKDPVRRKLLKPEAIFEYETGLALSALDIAEQANVRAAWTRAFTALFERFDYLIAPTAQVFAFDAALTWPRTVAGQKMRSYHEWMATQCLITLSGCPSLAVPAGFSASGQPMGLQIISPPGKNAACFALAAAHEAAAGASITRRLPPRLA